MIMSLFFLLAASITQEFEDLADKPQIVIEKKMIQLEDYPDSYNPSVVKVDDGYLLSFRYCPDRYSNPWQNYIGVVLLDDAFEPISSAQLLNSRSKSSRTQSQAEDARMFTYRGRVFVTYNDNAEVNYPSYSDRRDIYIAEIINANNQFSLSAPIKLFYENKRHILWQKNWVPFEWDKKLLVGYSVNPHEILYANLQNGACYPCYETVFSQEWLFGTLRGSTAPIMVDGEYLAFFHSGTVTSSFASWGWDMWHYFMGAYTFLPSRRLKSQKFPLCPSFLRAFIAILP